MFLELRRSLGKLVPYAILLGLFLFCVAFAITGMSTKNTHALTGINQQINFQGRLYNSAGAIVPDGNYNIQFKIYQDGNGLTAGDTGGTPAGSLKWTESYLNTTTQGVSVVNGFMSVQLGSITPFGTNIDWNQDTLWLSMNIGTTNTTCTPFTACTPDGEMLPMKRLSATPYSLNSNKLNGLNSTQFVQLAQGVQADASANTSSIFLNKTGTGGTFLQLQSAAVDLFTLNNTGDIVFGSSTTHSISGATAAASSSGGQISISGGTGGSGTGSTGGALVLQGGTAGGTNGNGGTVSLDGGTATGTGTAGTIAIGTASASTIYVGSTGLTTGTQSIYIGAANASGGTTNVTVGAGASASAGTTSIQSKNNTTISTNGVARGTFDTSGALYLGNGVTAGAPSNFAVNGTASTTTGVGGGALTIQGGNATVGNANGGNLTLTGGNGVGTGTAGLVVFTTPTFSTTTNDTNCYTGGALVTASCTIASNSVNNSSAIIVGFSIIGQSATLPSPTNTTPGRVVYVTAANGSSDFTLVVNGGGTGNSIAMRQNTSATMIYNGTAWTAAGASSSTTLQSAYDNTLQSAGGAELVVSKTATTNGLTIRDSSTAPVNGTLLSVQTASAAGLFTVNSNVTEYVTNAGAETVGSGGSTSFPTGTWASSSASTVTRYTTAGNYINTGQASVQTVTTATANAGVKNTLSTALNANMNYNVSFTTRLLSGSFTDLNVYYSVDGTTASVLCATGKTSATSVWTKVNCTFTAPASGITSANAILIQQTSGVTRTFYVDNLSVTIAADYSYATDGGVHDAVNFGTNYTSAGLGTVAVSRNTADGYDNSDSAQAAVTVGAVNAGLRNKLSVNPIVSTLYRVSVYAKLNSGTAFSDFKIRYSRDGSTGASGNYVDCVDYNTQTLTTTSWTQITCYITTDGTAPTSPFVHFVETTSAVRNYSIDTFSMTLASNTAPNVQIGGGINGGPTTLLTLDKGASAPIASNNDALLGSMYYDTTLGKLQCYEADGWGACGSSPDNIITISPEYTNAVLHGSGIGTMTSDLCSDTLAINNSGVGTTICGTNETYNFYKWTSPQTVQQTYSIYVTYQLPSTFKAFASGSATLKGRTDSSNSLINYQIYRSDATAGLTACGSAIAVSSGSVTSWQTGTASGTADPSTCGFIPGNSIVFQINMKASQNANAYASNLNFRFSNR